MYARDIKLIDDFYRLSEFLNDDIDMICDFIKDKIPKRIKRYKRSRVKYFIENAFYDRIDIEIHYILDELCINKEECEKYMKFHNMIQANLEI